MGTHSTGILDVLADMKEKAEGSLSDLRKAETNSKHNFEMLKQSLEDQMAADTKDMDDEKAAKAEAAEGKATAEGDLGETLKLLKNTKDDLATASATCMQVAADHQATVTARNEELKAIATATKILKDTTSGAASQTYSMLQVARLQSRADLAGLEVVQMIKQLAKKHHSSALATSIIGVLEVVESDFATGLAKEESQEDDAAALYDQTTQENKVTKTMKDQDLKYKTAEVK